MMGFIVSLGIWNWFIVGVLLLAVEIVAQGTFMLWLGVSAILVGLISLVIDWSWQAQLMAFAVLAVVSVIVWWRLGHRPRESDVSDQPFLNRRADAFVGRIFTLDKPIVGGAGIVKIDDTIWRVTGPDAPAGSRVKISRADGATLYVVREEG